MEKFLESVISRDPAAKSKISVILTYPGVKAVFFHKIGPRQNNYYDSL